MSTHQSKRLYKQVTQQHLQTTHTARTAGTGAMDGQSGGQQAHGDQLRGPTNPFVPKECCKKQCWEEQGTAGKSCRSCYTIAAATTTGMVCSACQTYSCLRCHTQLYGDMDSQATQTTQATQTLRPLPAVPHATRAATAMNMQICATATDQDLQPHEDDDVHCAASQIQRCGREARVGKGKTNR